MAGANNSRKLKKGGKARNVHDDGKPNPLAAVNCITPSPSSDIYKS